MPSDLSRLVEAALRQSFRVQGHRHKKIRIQKIRRVRITEQAIRENVGNDPRRIGMLIVFQIEDQPSAVQSVRDTGHCRIEMIGPSVFFSLRRKIDRQPAPFDPADTVVT